MGVGVGGEEGDVGVTLQPPSSTSGVKHLADGQSLEKGQVIEIALVPYLRFKPVTPCAKLHSRRHTSPLRAHVAFSSAAPDEVMKRDVSVYRCLCEIKGSLLFQIFSVSLQLFV